MYLLEGFRSNLMRFALAWCFFIISITNNSTALGQTTVIFQDDFESGIGTWSADNGLWEVGVAVVGPDSAHSGQNVAGTVLNGNYPDGANTRFISPQISLPELSSDEKLLLKFWYWFRIADDLGRVQISVDNGVWQTISGTVMDGSSPVWTQFVADLSEFANLNVRIGFLFVSDGSTDDSGWYIDDVSIEKGPAGFINPEDFENGVGNWSADNGLWQVGIPRVPNVGPEEALSGSNVAGTVLNGNYPDGANTRLISPEVTLLPNSGQPPLLCFWHWFRIADDAGSVQISTEGGDWETISNTFIDGESTVWTQVCFDLSAYADSTVRIGFLFVSDGSANDNGWYIDDIRFEGVTSIDESEASIPTQFVLQQNYPNPFNPTTTISYQLPKSAQVVLTIYNLLGREITKLVDENKSVGEHTIQWDGRGYDGNEVSSGVYVYRLSAGSFQRTRKMLLLR